jgi:integral membrane protein
MSYVTGTTLLILTFFIFLHGFAFTVKIAGSNLHLKVPGLDYSLWRHLHLLVAIVGIGHGVVLYPIYMVTCFQFALKVHLHVGYVVLMMLAGFVPGLAFYMERRMEHKAFPRGHANA